MVFKSLVTSSLLTVATMFAVGCSGTADNSGSSSKAESTQQPAATSNSDKPNTTAAPTPAAAGGSAFDATQLTAAGKATSDTPIGCALPDKIAKPLASQLTNTSSGSWANSGSAKNIASVVVGNLDLSTCPWYRQAKAQGGAYYMITYTDASAKQTYAQLSTSVNPVAFALCLTEATAVGAVCGFMP
jgi:cytoskeletal protein RodZ